MPQVEANGITINYTLEGIRSNDLVVLVNGLADDLSTWEAQMPALLSAGYQVLRYDNRGIGRTSSPPGPYTAEMLADDLHALLTHPDLHLPEKMHLLGVSMGGMILQSYALKYPNGSAAAKGKVMRSLSLCCTYAEPSIFCSRMFGLWADMAQRMSVQDVMRDVTLWAFTLSFFRQRTEELKAVDGMMQDLNMSTDAYLSQLNVIRKFDVTQELERLKAQGANLGGLNDVEVLVLAGEEDILIPTKLSIELANRIKAVRFEKVKGGHACLWEFPDEFNKTIIQYLDENRSSRT